RQEIRPLHVDVEQPIETLFAGLKDVGADLRSDAGVVHEQIEAAKLCLRELHYLAASRGGPDVSLAKLGADRFVRGARQRDALLRGLASGGVLGGIIDDQVPAEPG